ncbi:MerR family transcriptional regulator [Actinopolymorpha alba]|uniref:MerR family transcriptional regulator n=1 Tax=Actinopolymorpha alba TaxID=533267 RepID=UPI00037AECD0|nr:MerR family transcriptional regulator [Actinopolymorpha alba]
MATDPWTISELSEQVAAALSAASSAQASGRVREVPDARTIRWYQTTGLVDRPQMRGRSASYGVRHLLQVLAIKKLQGRGLALSDIQADLAGASDETLARIAEVPIPLELSSELPSGQDRGLTADLHVPSGAAARTRFWAGPARASVSAHATVAEVAEVAEVADQRPADAVAGVRLADGVLLILDGLPRTPDAAEVAALHEAAQPLVDRLQQFGLLPPARLTDPTPDATRRSPTAKEQA